MTDLHRGVIAEGYARLPEDLLHDLLDDAGRLVGEVERLLGTNLDNQDQLRRALEDLGLVTMLRERPAGTLSGIDGGYAIERTASVDLSLSVAVGVEGLAEGTTYWEGTQYAWWSRVGKHDIEAERLCRGTMVAQELAITANAPHDFRILDGSHLTPVIQLNSALTMSSDELRHECARIWDRLQTTDALAAMASDEQIVAMPKYDSSRAICDRLEARAGTDVPGDDKLLMSLLLRPDEYTEPQQVAVEPWARLHFDSGGQEHEEWAEAFQSVVQPLVDRELSFTYFKPDPLSPAFRIEIKRGVPMATVETILSTLKKQMTGPFVREPYPQYLADVMAKSVGIGLSALQSSVQLELSRSGRAELAELLLTSYRTEGV